jgi:hypothetical protein
MKHTTKPVLVSDNVPIAGGASAEIEHKPAYDSLVDGLRERTGLTEAGLFWAAYLLVVGLVGLVISL